MMQTVMLAGQSIDCRLTNGTVRDAFPVRRGFRLEVSPDAAPNTTQVFQLSRGGALEEGERIAVIEFKSPLNGQWTVVAVACHSTRTWFLECSPARYLLENSLVRRYPSANEVTGFAMLGCACLMLTLAGLYWLALTPVLLPVTLYSARDFLLRRAIARQSSRMITILDVLSTDIIGPRTWQSQFMQRRAGLP